MIKVNPHLEQKRHKEKRPFMGKLPKTDNWKLDEAKKYERLLKVYVWCANHNNFVNRQTGLPAPEWAWEFAMQYLVEKGEVKFPDLCKQCIKEELQKQGFAEKRGKNPKSI